jgi:hypothetical protein
MINECILDTVFDTNGSREEILKKVKDDFTAYVEQLCNQKVPLAELEISKTLRSKYANPGAQPHFGLNERIKKRDRGSAYAVNDRVPYVFIELPGKSVKQMKKITQGLRVEDPKYIEEHKIPVDVIQYLESSEKPVWPFIEILFGEGESWFKNYIDREIDRRLERANQYNEEFGFEEIENEFVFDDYVKLLKEYVDETGVLPKTSVKNSPHEKKLAKFITLQKQAKKRKTNVLSIKRIKIIEDTFGDIWKW